MNFLVSRRLKSQKPVTPKVIGFTTGVDLFNAREKLHLYYSIVTQIGEENVLCYMKSHKHKI